MDIEWILNGYVLHIYIEWILNGYGYDDGFRGYAIIHCMITIRIGQDITGVCAGVCESDLV